MADNTAPGQSPPQWEIRFYSGGGEKPFYVRNRTGGTQDDGIREAMRLMDNEEPVTEDVPEGVGVYYPMAATHFTVVQVHDPVDALKVAYAGE